MSRLVHAAEQLSAEVTAIWEDAVITHGEPDGLNVRRALKFEPEISKQLEAALRVVNDARVKSITPDEGGLVVVFVDSYRADTRAPFDLDAALEVAAKSDDGRTDFEMRRDELRAIPVDELRGTYPDYETLTKKELINGVLFDEGYDVD